MLNFRNLEEGKLSQSGESTAELIALVSSKFASTYVLCPGLVGLKDVEGTLGYLPSKVLHTSPNTAHSKTCKFWHIPSGKALAGASSYDTRWCNVCSECRRAVTYINRKVKEKAEMKPEMKYRRQDPSSNYKVKYLSPGSATVRYNRLRLQRKTMKKKIRKFYQKTKVELPDAQSKELCKLIGAIEDSSVGRKELECIEKEGNQYLDKDGISSGTILADVWRKDRESFFKDQMKNGDYIFFLSLFLLLCITLRKYRTLCN